MNVMEAAGIVMFAIFISRILGFVREMVIANVFGRGYLTDIFYAAFSVPDLMYYLLVGGALSAAFIPVFTSYLAKDDEETGWEVASTFLNITVILLLVFTILGIIFTPWLAPLVAYGFEGEHRLLLIKLMRMMFPAVLFTALAGLEMGILNSYKLFAAPAFGPIIYNICIIAGAVFLGPRFGISGMAVGVVVGAIGSFLLQLPFVLRKSRYKLVLNLRHPGILRMVSLMIPSLIGLSISQINLIINQNLASGLSGGDITALRLANRLVMFPVGIFAMGISTAIFPTLSRQAAREEITDFKSTLSLGLRSVFLVTVPSAVGFIVLREPIVRLLFERGEFTHADTLSTAYALLFYSLGLVAQSGVQVITRIYYALQDTLTPVKIGLATVLVNVVLNLGLLKFTTLSHGGLALANSIAVTINMLVLFFVLRRKIRGADGKRIVVSILKSGIVSVVMGVVVWLAYPILGRILGDSGTLRQVLQVVGTIFVGIVVFGVGVMVLRMEEAYMVLDIVKRRLRRSR